ncbi:MAG: ATPase domain-containing protein, partial [Methylacidiphilaceae bacterium]|nr:ATPase domain-containing protein [Candidatus Methylacidiphilaceae bacterium]
MTACTILGALYWALAHFLGEAGAREKVRAPARKYLSDHVPPGTVLGLNKYLVKLALEGGQDGPPPAPPEGEKPGDDGAGETKDGGENAAAQAGTETKGQGGRPEYGREDKERDWITEAGKVGVTAESEGKWGTGEDEGGTEAGTEEPAKEPVPDMAAQFSGTVPWLGDTIPRGCSLLVDGPGDTKERCALQFLKDGLAAGENGIALISYSPDEFRRKMKAIGFDTADVEESGKLRILDWATFRERTVNDLEDEGPVMILPKELPFVGSAVNLAMGELEDTGSPRMFINILPMALKTVAVETVFNFVQVTILKLKKKNLTGLYLWEKETDPEKASMRGSFHSTVEISPLEKGRIQVKTGGPLLPPKLRHVVVKGDRYSVEKEEALTPAEDEPGAVAEYRKKMEEYRIQGYRVSKLEAALGNGGQATKKAFEDFTKAVERMKSVRAELKIMDLSGPDILATGIPDMLKDVDQVEKAEKALKTVQEQERRKREAKRAEEAGKAGKAPAETGLPEGGEGAVPESEPVVVGKDGTVKFLGPPKGMDAGLKEPGGALAREPAPVSEEARKKEFKDALDKWRSEGFIVAHLEQAMALDVDRLRREFVLFRVQLGRLREMEAELGAMEGPGLAAGKARLTSMLRDVSRIPEIEKGIAELRRDASRLAEEERIRKDAERKRKAELSSKLVWWASHGIHTETLEKIKDGEPDAVDRAFSEFEAEAQRLLRVREELAGLDVSSVPDSARKLESLLGDVSRAGQAEQALASLREEISRNSRDAIARRAMREKLADWKVRGYRVTALEGLVEKDPTAAAAEVERFALGVMALEQMAQTVAGLDVRGFEERALEVRSRLRDPADVEQAGDLLKRLRH